MTRDFLMFQLLISQYKRSIPLIPDIISSTGDRSITPARRLQSPTMMSPPPPLHRSSQSRPASRQSDLASVPSNPFAYDDDSQQDGEGFSQTQRDVPRSQMSESEEVSGTQLDPRQKYCRADLLFSISGCLLTLLRR